MLFFACRKDPLRVPKVGQAAEEIADDFDVIQRQFNGMSNLTLIRTDQYRAVAGQNLARSTRKPVGLVHFGSGPPNRSRL
jgi:hypothetical protein